MLAGRERGVAGLQFQADKNNREGIGGFLSAAYFYFRRAWIHVRWRKDCERTRRGGENESGQPGDGDVIGVGIAAETVAEELEAVGNGGDARGFGDGLRSGRNVCGGIDGAGDAAAASLNGGGDFAEDERRNEKGATSGVGGDFITVGEEDGDAGSEAAGDIEYG